MEHFTILEVTEKEMESILKQREKLAREALIQEKAKEIIVAMEELKALGGRIVASREGKSRYLGQGSNPLYVPKASKLGLDFQI